MIIFLGDNVSLLLIKVARMFTYSTCMHTVTCNNLMTTHTVFLAFVGKKTIGCIEHGMTVCVVVLNME